MSQTKRGGEERKRRKRWWGGQKKRKNYKLPKKNYKLNFIKINNVCTLKDDYQANRKDILINHRFDKGLVFRTQKELSQLNNKIKNK